METPKENRCGEVEDEFVQRAKTHTYFWPPTHQTMNLSHMTCASRHEFSGREFWLAEMTDLPFNVLRNPHVDVITMKHTPSRAVTGIQHFSYMYQATVFFCRGSYSHFYGVRKFHYLMTLN